MPKSEAMDYYSGETPTVRAIRMVMEEAAARERERCAKIVEEMTEPSAYPVVVDARQVIAAAIRNPFD